MPTSAPVVAALWALAVTGACGDDASEPDRPDAPIPGTNPHSVAPGAAPGSPLAMAYVGGRPVVAYVDAATRELRFAAATVETPRAAEHWVEHVVDGAGDAGLHVAVVEAGGAPVIAYYDAAAGALAVAVAATPEPADAADWTAYRVDDAGDVGQFAAISYASVRVPTMQHLLAVAYYDAGERDAKVAYAATPAPATAADWTTVAVDTAGDVGSHIDVVVDVDSGLRMSVAYYDATERQVKFARAGTTSAPTGAGDWAALVVASAVDAEAIDLELGPDTGGIGPKRWAMVWHDATLRDLVFGAVSLGLGLDEVASHTVVDVGADPALHLASTGPLVVFRDDTAGALQIAQSVDSQPEDSRSWTITPLAADAATSPVALAMPCGPEDVLGFGRATAAAVYVGAAGGVQLGYRTEPHGDWFVHRVRPLTSGVIYGNAIAVGGQLAAAYPAPDGVHVAVAPAAMPWRADQWSNELAAAGVDAQWMSAAVVGGELAVAYYDRTTRSLGYSRRSDERWRASAVDDQAGRFASLVDIDGLAAIAYFDDAGSEVRVARESADGFGIAVVATGINAPDGVSIAAVGDRVGVAYGDNLVAHYASSSDFATWTSHAIGVEGSAVVTGPRLLVLDGRPVVVHRDTWWLSAAFASSSSPRSGADWEDRYVDQTNGAGLEFYAAALDGLPVIAHWAGPPDGQHLQLASGAVAVPVGADDWVRERIASRPNTDPGMIPLGIADVDAGRAVVFSAAGCMLSAYR